MQAASGVTHFLTNVLEVMEPDAWEAAPFHDSYDTDNALFIRAGCVEVLEHGWLDTALRDIDWWQLRMAESGEEFRVYSLHLKASQGYEDDRLAECVILRNALAGLTPGLPYLVTGDFNLYTAAEPAYQHLTAAGAGELIDPIDQEGPWHDNAAYACVHTQSTRTESFGGGATGGLDDRFDFILAAAGLLDGEGFELLPETYTAYANDCDHLNQSIIAGGNTAVPYEIAEAIYQSSDHLPLFAVLSCGDASEIARTTPAPLLLAVGPNPARSSATVRWALPAPAPVSLVIHDTAGRRVAVLAEGVFGPGVIERVWDGRDGDGRPVGTGVYCARLVTGGQVSVQRVVVVR
jgi:hypothetical protein